MQSSLRHSTVSVRRQRALWRPKPLYAFLAAALALAGPLVALDFGAAPFVAAAVGPPVITTVAGGAQPGVAADVANNVAMTPTDVVFDASDPTGKTVYAALGDPKGDSDPNASCIAKSCNGVYVSTNLGQSWSRVSGVDTTSTASSYGRISLAIAPGASPAASMLSTGSQT